MLESDRVGGLDGGSISDWIRERHTQFNDICSPTSDKVNWPSIWDSPHTSTALLHAEQDGGHELGLGEAGSDIGHEGSLYGAFSSMITTWKKMFYSLSVVPWSRPCSA